MAMFTTSGTSFASGSKNSSRGIFRRAFDNMIAARERQARKYVNGYLLTLDDSTLAAHGYSREALQSQGSTHCPM